MTTTVKHYAKPHERRPAKYRVSVIGTPPADLVQRISAIHALALSSGGLGEQANSGSKGPRSP